MRPGRRRAVAAKKGCTCRTWVTGPLNLNIERDEEDETIVLDVRSTTGFPKRTAVSPHVVVRWQAQVPWMAEDRKDGGFVVRTTNPAAEHSYKMVGMCVPCGLKLVEYQGAG